MQEFKEGLSSVSPIPYNDVPTEHDELLQWLRRSFQHAETILNSIPTPAQASSEPPTPFSPSPANSATNASETACDASAVPTPSLQGRDPELQKQWGKPIRFSAKDNPLGVEVFKMAAHDRHGAWFSRRSIHQGIGFEKMRSGMQREFLQSLKVKEGPGSGAVRGVAADRRVEKQSVQGVGNIEVWQTSSVFPGPVTPRECLTLVITSDNALSSSSAPPDAAKPPRHHLTISRPTAHPTISDRSGLVKMAYESAELIREMPLSPDADPESNPIEWLMITRSDPGGGIPKFMVERGTPSSIAADVSKWLDWACKLSPEGGESEPHEEAEAEADKEIGAESAEQDKAAAANEPPPQPNRDLGPTATTTTAAAAPHDPTQSGYLTRFTEAVSHTALGQTVADYMQPAHDTNHAAADDDARSTSSTSSSASSLDSTTSFASAVMHTAGAGADTTEGGVELPRAATDGALATAPDTSSKDPHTRELAKLHAKRLALEQKKLKDVDAAARKRDQASHKSEKDAVKAAERHDRELKRQEEKYAKEIRKIDAEREKKVRKEEERKRRSERKDVLEKLRAEKSDLRTRAEVSEREAEGLSALVEGLQREVAVLTRCMASLEGGPEMLEKARVEPGGAGDGNGSGKKGGGSGAASVASSGKVDSGSVKGSDKSSSQRNLGSEKQ